MNEPRRRRALITRPQEDSADIAIALARRGITPVLAPMMRIEYPVIDIENEISLAQAILFTSRNGVRAFSRLSPRRDIAVFAVGDSTAALARDSGFASVESARGDSADLARLVAERLKPADGLLFHAAGTAVAGDLVDTLNGDGFKTVRRALYEAKPADALAEDTVTALRDRTLDYVLFFSPRTGRIFADLVEEAGLGATCDSLTAICLSDAVASEVSGLPWKTASVAAAPTTDALIAVLNGFESGAPKPGIPADTKTATETAATESPTESTTEPAEEAAAEYMPNSPLPKAILPETPSPEAPDTPVEAPADPRPAAAPPAARRSTVAGSLPMAAGIAVAALAAAYLTLPMWRDHLPPEARERLAGTDAANAKLREETAELKIRIDDLDRSLAAAHRERAAAGEKAGREIGDLTKRLAASGKAADELRAKAETAAKSAGEITALSDRASALEQSLAAAVAARAAAENKAREAEDAQTAEAGKAAATVADMTGRIEALEKQIAVARAAALSAEKSDTIALAAGRLRDAIARAKPFPAEIAALKRLAGTNPGIAAAVARIEPFAAKGVAGRSSLFAGLPETVRKVVEATRTPQNTGWKDRALAKLTSFVTVRRVDGKGGDTDAVLARAEIAARRGDLAAAANEIATLDGDAARAAAPWLSSARARLAAEAASAALDKIALAAFAESVAGKGAPQ